MWRSTILSLALNLLARAMVQVARWAAMHRRRALNRLAARPREDKDAEIMVLREGLAELQSQVEILRRLHQPSMARRYTLRERFLILYHMSYFDVPRRRVQQTFGLARSTFYRWLRRIDGHGDSRRIAWNRTPAALARFVWQVAAANAHWGRVRIANHLRLLGIFVAPSTVRNILNRPKPPPTGEEEPVGRRRLSWRSIPAFYPNHLWSADVTRGSLWGLWPADVLVIIDHFSRKLVLVRPLVSLSSEAMSAAFEEAFRAVGPPKHLVTDRGFDSRLFSDFL